MFAIVRTGGKQLKVEVGQKVSVEKIDAKIGSEFVLDQVLMVGEGDKVSLGTPLLSGAAVKTVIEDQTRTQKIIVFKKKRRQNYRRKNGHRQQQTILKIVDIIQDGQSSKSKVTVEAVSKEKAPVSEKKAPTKKAAKQD